MNEFVASAFKYLDDTKYSQNDVLAKKLEKILYNEAESFSSSGSNFEWASEANREFLESINACALDLVSLMKLYKYILNSEGVQNLGTFSYEGEQFMFIADSFMSAFLSMMPEGHQVTMDYCAGDENEDEEE